MASRRIRCSGGAGRIVALRTSVSNSTASRKFRRRTIEYPLSCGDDLGHVFVDRVPFVGQCSSESGKPERRLMLLFSSPLRRYQGHDGTTSAHDHKGLAAANPTGNSGCIHLVRWHGAADQAHSVACTTLSLRHFPLRATRHDHRSRNGPRLRCNVQVRPRQDSDLCPRLRCIELLAQGVGEPVFMASLP